MRDFYQLLEVSRDADTAQIRSAYLRQAELHHPDRILGDRLASSQLADEFKRLRWAYEVLSDPSARARYDQFPEQFSSYRASTHTSTVGVQAAAGPTTHLSRPSAKRPVFRPQTFHSVNAAPNDAAVNSTLKRLRKLHRDNRWIRWPQLLVLSLIIWWVVGGIVSQILEQIARRSREESAAHRSLALPLATPSYRDNGPPVEAIRRRPYQRVEPASDSMAAPDSATYSNEVPSTRRPPTRRPSTSPPLTAPPSTALPGVGSAIPQESRGDAAASARAERDLSVPDLGTREWITPAVWASGRDGIASDFLGSVPARDNTIFGDPVVDTSLPAAIAPGREPLLESMHIPGEPSTTAPHSHEPMDMAELGAMARANPADFWVDRNDSYLGKSDREVHERPSPSGGRLGSEVTPDWVPVDRAQTSVVPEAKSPSALESSAMESPAMESPYAPYDPYHGLLRDSASNGGDSRWYPRPSFSPPPRIYGPPPRSVPPIHGAPRMQSGALPTAADESLWSPATDLLP